MKRQMWLGMCVGIAAFGLGLSPAGAQEEGFKAIFDGKTLEGWDGNPKFWRVEEGILTGQTTADNPTSGNTFIIWRAGETGDFELKCQYRIVGGNSGIQYRSFEVENEKWVIGGYQADFEAGDTYSGILYGERFRGILAGRGEKTVIGPDHKPQVVGKVGDSAQIQSKIKKEDWNDYHIIARGFNFVHKINGVVTAECTDEDKEMRRAKGVLALQLHAGPPMKVQFRNIRIKKTDGAPGVSGAAGAEAKKKVVLVAGNPSHGWGAHDHSSGCALLAKALNESGLPIEAVVTTRGWPQNPEIFDGAAAVIIYADGGGGHPVNPHLEAFDKLTKKGVGLGCIHYGVEVPKGPSGEKFLDWIGGYFEPDWSVNPHWQAEFKTFPDHPVARGVSPFAIQDEWYYHMRFREKMKGVTPILTAMPPAGTLSRGDGPHSGNPHVRAAVLDRKEAQHMMWVAERPDGGRGFGFTGGHVHWNWGNDQFRKVVLNGIAWIAKVEVPAGGVPSKTPTAIDLEANQDEPKPENWDSGKIQETLDRWNGKKSASAPLSDSILEEEVEAVAGLCPAEGPSERSPESAVAGLDVGEGLEASLFAAEPMLFSPSNIDIDHRGRVWVCEIINYRGHNGKRAEGDRIVIVEDGDGDGKADKVKVFYQSRQIDSPHGVTVLATPDGKGTRVIVSAGDKVQVLTDDDGDDKADRAEVLFSGISGTQHDHGIHQFIFGPDGKLYFNFGNSGNQIKDKGGKPIVDKAGNEVAAHGKPYRQGMVFRCNLDGSEFETLGWNFRNNWMVTVDSFGTLWQSDNDDDGNKGVRINYVMEFGNYGYTDEMTGAGWSEARTNLEEDVPSRHWHLNDPGVVPNLLVTGAGSPTGIAVYEADLLPEVYRNQVLHCDAGPNIVRAYPVKKDGAGYSAQSVNILEGTRDKWFRPADVKVAPDGSLIVADWYDPGVGGHAMGDLERGRLFRVTPKGHQGYKIPKYDFSSANGCIEALSSPTPSVRYVAWQGLHGMGTKAEAALAGLWKSDNPRLRARALWLLGRMEGKGSQYITQALGDSDTDIRICALRLVRNLNQDVIAPIKKLLAGDSDAQVRRECAIALRGHKSPEAPALWAQLAAKHDGKDRWYLEALGIGAEGQWDAFFGAWLKQVGDGWNTPAGRDIIWRSRSKAAPEYLAKIVKALPEKENPRYMRAFDFHTGPEKEAALKAILGL